MSIRLNEDIREELDAEWRAMTRTWKKREGQLARLTGGMPAIAGHL